MRIKVQQIQILFSGDLAHEEEAMWNDFAF